MLTYGQRPDDVVTDSRGNSLPGVTIRFYETEADALGDSSRVGEATTDSGGRWSFDTELTELWGRMADGSAWRLTWSSAPPGLTGTGVTDLEVLTQAEYDLLSPPDPTTLYIVVG